ncbi:MAG: toll/interleukin-1 receptor domain-containing protein [Promethearchaeota archaeon]
MIFQYTPDFAVSPFDLIHYAFIVFIILMVINSIKQKYKYTILITWIVFFVAYIIIPLLFYGIPLLAMLIFYLNISYMAPMSYYSIIFYIFFEPLSVLLVTVLSIFFSRRKKKLIKHIRAPALIKSFPIDRELIFISYATVDSDFFQIPKITRVLSSYPEIKEILYWEADMHDDIYQYMDDNLKQCKVVLLFCSKNSLYSEAVKMEWRSALKLGKKLIPIFVEPNDIPALLSTKLGIQFKESDPYTTIEDIYQMILKKLEIEPLREFTKFLVPKWITETDFKELNPETTEKSLIFDTDITSKDLGLKMGLILQENNFFVPGLKDIQTPKKKVKKRSDPLISDKGLNHLYGFAELKDDSEDISLNIKIQRISENLNKVFIKAEGRREWVLNEILKDINMKLIELKSTNELIRDYSEQLVSLLDQIGDIEKFLRKNLSIDFKKIVSILTQYNENEIEKEEFIIKCTQLVGKSFITAFIENRHPILKESKKMKIKKPIIHI